jgi:hypothetical protein
LIQPQKEAIVVQDVVFSQYVNSLLVFGNAENAIIDMQGAHGLLLLTPGVEQWV